MIIRALQGSDWLQVKPVLKLCWSENTKGVVAEEDGKLLAVMVCQGWTESSVQIHVWLPHKKALKHKFHYACCDYIFNQCGKIKILGTVPSNNAKAIKLNKHLGCTEVARIKDAFAEGVDAIIMELHRDDCKYLERHEEAA